MTSSRVLATLVTWFLYAFAADASLSVVLDVGRAAFGISSPAADILRNIFALVVVFWALVLFAVIFITPRVRKRAVLLPVLFALWAGLTGAFPLFFVGLPNPILWVSLAQLAIAFFPLLPLLRGRPVVDDSRPAFSWWNLASGVAIACAFGLLMLSSLVGAAAQAAETSTAGFLRIRPSGLYLEERTFRKGDKEIRLIAMMHIARRAFYEDLASELRESDSAVVLMEGVTDEKGLLKKGFGYSGLAGAIGASAQEDSSLTTMARESLSKPEDESDPLIFRRADIDVSDFQPGTVSVIETLGDLLSSKSLREALGKLQNPHSPIHDEAKVEAALEEIVNLRNGHLLDSVHGALAARDTVIVPWGALHMPFLSAELKALGFVEVGKKARLAISFAGE